MQSIHQNDLWPIALTSLALRLLTVLIVCIGWHISFADYTHKGDGASYQHVAAAILGDSSALSDYDQRVFIGYPLLIAAVHILTFLPMSAASLLVTLISAAAVPALTARFCHSRRAGWAAAILYPHVWCNFALPMGEAPMLLFALAGLLAGRNQRAITAGIFFGLAMLIRPVAIFALLGWLVDRLAHGHFARAVESAIFATVVGLLGLLLSQHLYGSALHNVTVYAHSSQAYGGAIFTWPLHSILWMTFFGHPGVWRWLYISAHPLLAAVAVWLLWQRPRQAHRPVHVVWLTGNTAFALCVGLGAGNWGFEHLPRFLLPALPPLAMAYSHLLPRRKWPYVLIAVGLLVLSAVQLAHTPINS